MGKELEVGTQSTTIEATPTLDTNAYAAGDRAGTLMTLSDVARSDGESATLIDIVVLDKAKQSKALDIMFFNASPTIASADNAAIDISDAEMAKCIGTVNIPAANYLAVAGNSVATVRTGICMKPAAGSRDLYALVVAGDTATYAASSLVIKFKFAQD